MKTFDVLHAETSLLSVEQILRESARVFEDDKEIDTFTEEKDGSAAVRHTCIVPSSTDYKKLSETHEEIRREYPFKLDRFQELALKCLERDESILVSAHTSAGKTLIAEYAIHLSILRKQRVIYTSPIKALSNQKYRELNEKFGDVGLMTGDVTLNPDSTCIVMTTEILRNMIYKGTEILRETHFVVFDEVHYMRDRERGVVWEETIILLPSSTRFIFLSATIPNAEEFARWIVNIHRQPCHVIYTEKRPTPLEHYIYVNGEGASATEKEEQTLDKASRRVFLIVDKKGAFREENFARIQKSAAHSKKREKINVVDILKVLKSTNNLPTIVFSFRRKECEDYAVGASTNFDFNNDTEKNLIEVIFNNALKSLREEDRKLQQITGLKGMLLRGIGVHHSGLLPIVKEIIEILFQENLLKVLFATETFSIGLNMPAKSVVFTTIKKFDGVQTRFVTSGEYIQMSGRAGRRGTDKIGNVILALESSMEIGEAQIKSVLHGPSNTLDSAFKLSYNTILNILKLDGMDEEHVVKNSFLQFRQELKGKELQNSVTALIKRYAASKKKLEGLESALRNRKEVEKTFALKMQAFQSAKALLPNGPPKSHMAKGRLVVVCRVPRLKKEIGEGADAKIEYPDVTKAMEKVLAIVFNADTSGINVVTEEGETAHFPFSAVLHVSKMCLALGNGVSPIRFFKQYFEDRRKRGEEGEKAGAEIKFYQPHELTLGASGQEVKENQEKIELLCEQMYEKYVTQAPAQEKKEIIKTLRQKSFVHALETRITKAYREKEKTKLVMINEYNSKRRILQALFYTSESEVLIKGKVASEISSGDELLLTEMLFNNEFAKLPPGRICSLISCVVFDEKADNTTLTEESARVFEILKKTAKRLAAEFRKLDESFREGEEKEYLEKLCPRLMDVVYLWTEGYNFGEICSSTDVFEGSIIRCFRRLEEVLKEMCRAAKVVGNTEMENKFSAAISLVKRDIVFANSLYL